MHSHTNDLCASAIRCCEQRVQAAVARDYHAAARFQAELELIRKAWQIVLCARWEAQIRRELASGSSRMLSSDSYARGKGTA